MNTNEAQGACNLCRDIQRDASLAEIYDVRNHTNCGVCPAELLEAEAAGNASCSFQDGVWRWDVLWIPVNVAPRNKSQINS